MPNANCCRFVWDNWEGYTVRFGVDSRGRHFVCFFAWANMNLANTSKASFQASLKFLYRNLNSWLQHHIRTVGDFYLSNGRSYAFRAIRFTSQKVGKTREVASHFALWVTLNVSCRSVGSHNAFGINSACFFLRFALLFLSSALYQFLLN